MQGPGRSWQVLFHLQLSQPLWGSVSAELRQEEERTKSRVCTACRVEGLSFGALRAGSSSSGPPLQWDENLLLPWAAQVAEKSPALAFLPWINGESKGCRGFLLPAASVSLESCNRANDSGRKQHFLCRFTQLSSLEQCRLFFFVMFNLSC